MKGDDDSAWDCARRFHALRRAWAPALMLPDRTRLIPRCAGPCSQSHCSGFAQRRACPRSSRGRSPPSLPLGLRFDPATFRMGARRFSGLGSRRGRHGPGSLPNEPPPDSSPAPRSHLADRRRHGSVGNGTITHIDQDRVYRSATRSTTGGPLPHERRTYSVFPQPIPA